MADQIKYLLSTEINTSSVAYYTDSLNVGRFIGQQRPSPNNTAQAILTVGANQIIQVNEIYVANLANAIRHFTIYVDPNGATWNDDTKIYEYVETNKHTGARLPVNILLENEGATIAVECDRANDMNFMAFGNIISLI